MAMTKAKRARLAKRGSGAGTAGEAMGLAGRVRTGAIVAPREVQVTSRQSIDRKFVAPRPDMGEYTPAHY